MIDRLGDLTTFFEEYNPHTIDINKKYTPESMPNIKGASAKVKTVCSEFEDARDYFSEERERESDNWNLYSGVNEKQWEKEIASIIKDQNRNPFQANLIRPKVDGMVGALIKNGFDIDYKPVDGKISDLTKILKEIYLSDKEMLDWSESYRQLVTNGCVFLGMEEMFVSFKYSPLGNIAFKTVEPGHFILDPNWTSANANELRKVWKTAYLTPEEMKDIYDTKGELIDSMVERYWLANSTWDKGDTDKGMVRFGLDERYEQKFRVIEQHAMRTETKKIEIDIATGMVIPDGNEETKLEWYEANGLDPKSPSIKRKQSVDVYYVTTVCPELSPDTPLEDRPGLVQIGRLPFFPWSFARINGVNSGLPDQLKSLQRTLNKRESLIDHIVASSAQGAHAVDPDIVDSDRKEMDHIEKNWHSPSFKFWTKPGALSRGKYFEELPRGTRDYAVLQDINRYVDMMDRVSKQPAASDARSEGSEESGILFARKQLQAEINLTTVTSSLAQHWNDKGEAYLYAAKQLYGGTYREFVVPKKGSLDETSTIAVNVPYITPEGEVTLNDISMLPRMKVVIAQSPEGATMRATDRAINVELLRVFPQDNPMLRSRAARNVMKTLDQTTVERQEMEQDAELEMQLARQRAKTELINAEFQQLQMQAGIMQLQAQMQGGMMGGQAQPGQEGQAQEGNPQEGKNPPGNPGAQLEGSNQQLNKQIS